MELIPRKIAALAADLVANTADALDAGTSVAVRLLNVTALNLHGWAHR